MLPPVAIVWPCPLSVDEYVAAGRDVEVPCPDCPGCAGATTRWSGYRRFVRSDGLARAIFVPRVRCVPCKRTDAVLPAFVVAGRLDVAESIGAAVAEAAVGPGGVRPAATRLCVPHTTARGWVRRFGARAQELAVAFAALAVEFGAQVALGPVSGAARRAVEAISAAFEAACSLPGWSALGRWRFASAVSGGRLLATNTDTPYLVVGRRRFMPPVP